MRALPWLFLAALLVHGATIGLTDDEAYYWVLAQRPDWAYAYHPPAVAWLIAATQGALGWLVGKHSALGVRLPGALCISAAFALVLSWLRSVGVPEARMGRATAVMFSFAGVSGLAWMMVPDLPLLLGWSLLFVGTWRTCFGGRAEKADSGGDGFARFAMLAGGTAFVVLAKYSGLLTVGSAVLCVLIWAPRARKLPALGLLALAAGVSAIPILIWNAQHHWASILYQVRERHGGGGAISGIRYLRFWVIELFAAGPWLIAFAAVVARYARRDRTFGFFAAWIIPPALVYCVQPLFSDFKPHWAFIVWWPAALALAWASGTGALPIWERRATWQIRYGLGLAAFVWIACQFPVISAATRAAVGEKADPRWDVTNDLYGWDGLAAFLEEKLGPEGRTLPVVASRYQTASQAAFALAGTGRAVSMLPRDEKARDEWLSLALAESEGPEWTRLRKPLIYVADIRFSSGPGFPQSTCRDLGRLEVKRGPYLAKWIQAWRCEP